MSFWLLLLVHVVFCLTAHTPPSLLLAARTHPLAHRPDTRNIYRNFSYCSAALLHGSFAVDACWFVEIDLRVLGCPLCWRVTGTQASWNVQFGTSMNRQSPDFDMSPDTGPEKDPIGEPLGP